MPRTQRRSGLASNEQVLELGEPAEQVGEAAQPVAHLLMAHREIGTGRRLDAGQAAHDVPAREPQPALDHEHEPARTRRWQRAAPCDVAVEDRAEDGGLDVVEARSLRNAEGGRAELTG